MNKPLEKMTKPELIQKVKYLVKSDNDLYETHVRAVNDGLVTQNQLRAEVVARKKAEDLCSALRADLEWAKKVNKWMPYACTFFFVLGAFLQWLL